MWKTASLFILCLMISSLVVASNDSLKVELIRKNKIELSPGSITNIAIMLINNSKTPKKFLIKAKTPDGCSLISNSKAVEVFEESNKVKVLSFSIAESASVGDHNIVIEVYNADSEANIATLIAPVYILPKYNIMVKQLESPKFVFAGDTVNVKFILQNLSNIKVKAKVEIVNINIIEYRSYSIAPDSVIIIKVTANAIKNITKIVRNSVSINVTLKDNNEIRESASYIFNVLPLNEAKFDAYKRFPINISGLLVTDNQFGERVYGAMFNVYGKGEISKRNKRMLEFRFLGPNRQGSPVLETTDQYYVKYSSTKSRATIGDNSYMLTDLTEGARTGRGLEYEHRFNKFSIGSFVNFPRFYPDVQRLISAYATYFPTKKIIINTGYINKLYSSNEIADMATISGMSSPLPWLNLKFEFAAGKFNDKISKAYSTSFMLNNFKSRLFFKYTTADKDFPGYLSNTRYISAGLSSSLIKKLSLSMNYNYNYSNIALDTMYANAPFSETMNFSIGYPLNKNHSISLGFFSSSREDRRIPKQFDYKKNTARLTYHMKFKKIGIRIYGAYGKTDNFLNQIEGELLSIINADMSIDYRMNKHVFVKGGLSYLGGQQYLIDDYTQLFFRALINADYNKFNLALQYQNNYEIAEYYRNRNLLGGKIIYSINKQNKFGVNLNYFIRKNDLRKKQFLARLLYTYTLNVPISKRDDIGSLEGKIVNNGVENIEGIAVTINGNIAFTDENGEFEFPIVKSGTHYLFIDNSKSGLNSIFEKPGPYKIDIIPGQKYLFEVSITKSGRIQGKLVLESDKNSGKKTYLDEKDKRFNLIIEASKGDELFRVFSKDDRTFAFEDLRPGIWKVKVYERGIPKGYKIETKEYMLKVNSGEATYVDIKIKKISRRIKFQN